jgi:hypothetical protein
MSQDVVKSLTELILAFAQLARVTGTGWFAVIVLGGTGLTVGVPWLREHLRNQRVDIVIQHKEQEVLRLAEDNRKYREVYLARLEVPPAALAHDSEDSKTAKAESGKKEAKRS